MYRAGNFDEVRIWWEEVEETYAHIGRPLFQYNDEFQRCLLNAPLGNIRSIVDYGCGGGNLGIHLFEKGEIEYYIGIDISRRSIEAAKKRLVGRKSEFVLNETEDFQFPDADAFMCFHVIQHFPNLDYANKFFRALNETNYKSLYIQFRYGETSLNNEGCVDISILLPLDYIISRLDKYQLLNQTYYKKDNYIYTQWGHKSR